MAFAYTVDEKTFWGDKKVTMGTWTNGSGDTGGDIVTGLKRVEMFWMSIKGTSSNATAPSVNETLPLAGGTVTIVSADNQDGNWVAVGL